MRILSDRMCRRIFALSIAIAGAASAGCSLIANNAQSQVAEPVAEQRAPVTSRRPVEIPPKPRATVSTHARVRPDGVTAPGCVLAHRGAENSVRNTCAYPIEVKAACLPSYVNEDEPYPGTYTLDSWLFTLDAGRQEHEPNADVCLKRGGKIVYAACQLGIPYFTTPDALRYGCFR